MGRVVTEATIESLQDLYAVKSSILTCSVPRSIES